MSAGRLYRRLRSGEQLFGLFTMFSEPALVEMAGYAGFDFVIVDTEHGPSTHESVQNCLRAADAADVDVLVRVPQGAYGDIQRVLDGGAGGIVMPHVRSVDDATRLVEACRLAPRGSRGTAFTARFGHYGCADPGQVRSAAEQVVAVAQIEDEAALEHLDEIAAVTDLDCLFLGPADLRASMQLGEDAPEILRSVIEEQLQPAAAANGRWWGSFVSAAGDIPTLSALGGQLFAVSGTSLIRDAFRQQVNAFRQQARSQ